MEQWKDIAGYENYEVSTCGNVRNKKTGRLLKPINKRGYNTVKLRKNGADKRLSIHRLVAETFIENPYNKPQVNHIDENKRNNIVENLEWCTNKENANHGTRNRRISNTLKSVELKRNGKAVIQKTLNNDFVDVFVTVRGASRKTKIDHTNIIACCDGKRKTAGGYRWSYF